MFSPTEPEQPTTTNPLKQFFATVFSYDGNVMLAALVSLLLVILFVLLLHIYAKWFLSQAQRRRRTPITAVSRHNRFHTFNLDSTTPNISTPKGLDSSTISTIPLFVYKTEEIQNPDYKNGVLEMECVICLTPFEDEDVGRNLPKCGHCFHVECIDMWLGSHVNCPICRAPVTMIPDGNGKNGTNSAADRVSGEDESVVINVSDSGFVENDCVDQVGVMSTESESTTSSSSSPVMVGCSLKRMLSRNRPESKVFPSSTGNDQMGD